MYFYILISEMKMYDVYSMLKGPSIHMRRNHMGSPSAAYPSMLLKGTFHNSSLLHFFFVRKVLVNFLISLLFDKAGTINQIIN